MSLPHSVHPLSGDHELAARLQSLVEAFGGRRILVVGDLIADEFIYGRLSRVSREAPVLILQYDTTQIVPGGAGNAANNVASLGGRVRLVGLIGEESVPIRHGAPILDSENKEVGTVTSGTVSPSTQRAVMLGYVGVKHLDKALFALVRGAPRPVRIASLPFVPKRYKK